MTQFKSFFEDEPDIVPPFLRPGISVTDLVHALGQTSFEARNLYRGSLLLRRMIDEGDVIWLGISGAGVAGGMGGMIISLLEAGFIDAICSTGAQVYHDLHFAFGLPVKAISPQADDGQLRRCGDTRIYDVGIREKETLEAQDEILRSFVKECYQDRLSSHPLSSWEFNLALGEWVLENSRYPERSFVARAAERGVPVFWDSLSNHSIAMNLVRTDQEGLPVILSAQKDILESAAITFASKSTSFALLGGGGPKNFIQQTGPTISQILAVDYQGADRGLQIGTAVEQEGSLSGCTFSEAVTWGKYHSVDQMNQIKIWSEYSLVFPLLVAYVLENCKSRPSTRLVSHIPGYRRHLEEALG
jgi:deoxyhypusine synthase